MVPKIPAAYFGIVLGLAGLGNAWRTAGIVWSLPAAIGEMLMAGAAAVWTVLVVLYIAKWIWDCSGALAELEHPVQCCFVGLIGVATMLIAMGAFPYARPISAIVFVAGASFTLGFGVWRTGLLWRGERGVGTTTAVLYLPLVAGTFVVAAGASLFGLRDWGQFAFGAGFFSWMAIESVLLQRLLIGPALPLALRPTLGIQLAPPAVGAVAYISVSNGGPDIFAHMMIGYGLLQALVLLRMLPWVMEQPFAPSYWAFTFGASALGTAPLRLMQRGEQGPIATLAPYLFAVANVIVLLVCLGTLILFSRTLLAKWKTPSSNLIIK